MSINPPLNSHDIALTYAITISPSLYRSLAITTSFAFLIFRLEHDIFSYLVR